MFFVANDIIMANFEHFQRKPVVPSRFLLKIPVFQALSHDPPSPQHARPLQICQYFNEICYFQTQIFNKKRLIVSQTIYSKIDIV